MALTSNLQRVVAESLYEGHGITLPNNYDQVHEHFVAPTGLHAGAELLECFEKRAYVAEAIDRSTYWLNEGEQIYRDLLEQASDSTIKVDEHVVLWGAMFRTLYRGALDHVVPLEQVRARLAELSGLPGESKVFFDILTPDDGKTVLYHHDHPVLLHLAHRFRQSPSGRWVGAYDGFDRSWLDLNYIPLSLDAVTDVRSDPKQKGINQVLRDIGLSREEYLKRGNDDEMEHRFQTVRNALVELMRKRSKWSFDARRAGDAIVAATPPALRENAESLLTLIGASLRLNEQVHRQVYLGLNVLRLAAQVRGEPGLRLTLAFTS